MIVRIRRPDGTNLDVDHGPRTAYIGVMQRIVGAVNATQGTAPKLPRTTYSAAKRDWQRAYHARKRAER
jgi:hypothetical protein